MYKYECKIHKRHICHLSEEYSSQCEKIVDHSKIWLDRTHTIPGSAHGIHVTWFTYATNVPLPPRRQPSTHTPPPIARRHPRDITIMCIDCRSTWVSRCRRRPGTRVTLLYANWWCEPRTQERTGDALSVLSHHKTYVANVGVRARERGVDRDTRTHTHTHVHVHMLLASQLAGENRARHSRRL